MVAVVRQSFPLLITLASFIGLFISYCEGSPLSSEIRKGRQPKQIFPVEFLQHPYQLHSLIYNRNHVPPPSDRQIGPFFGYFPQMFVVPSNGETTLPTTTTTTTTPTPLPLSTCVKTGPTANSPACPSCIDITATGGTIQSPKYPNDYETGWNCYYRITVSTGKKIKVTLSGGYNLDNTETIKDYITAVDGATMDATQFGSAEAYRKGDSDTVLGTSSGETIMINMRAGTEQGTDKPYKFELKYAEVA